MSLVFFNLENMIELYSRSCAESSNTTLAPLAQFRHPPGKLGRRVRLAKNRAGNGDSSGPGGQDLGRIRQGDAAYRNQNRTRAGLGSQPLDPFNANRRRGSLLGSGGKHWADGKIVRWRLQNARNQRLAAAKCANNAVRPEIPAGRRWRSIASIHVNAIKSDLLNQIN